ncbi:Holo-[acyl-carrier-protein] synthase [Phycisphaerae bacterium RAS1]|nr:Holo-[acyl-carrier-protein] synthase [Phycisphaerae bacterium RAS1]
MQILGHGVDIVVCQRIERIWREHGERFLDRIFTADERRYCVGNRSELVRLAGRFAAKEAVLKVLGTGWRGGIEWTDIEVLPDPLGRPLVSLHGQTAKLAAALGIRTVLVSISHAGDYAVASAIAVGDAGAT